MGCTVRSRGWPFPTVPIIGLCKSPFRGAFSGPHLRMEAYMSSFSCLQAPQDFSESLSALPFSCRPSELCQGSLVCGPEVFLCRFPRIRAQRLPLCSVSPSAPGTPSRASQQCCPSSCPPAVLFHSCLASAPVALLKKAFPRSLHHPPCLWPSEGSQLLHRPVSPLQGHQLPRAGAWQPCSLPCLLSLAGIAMYVFD